MDNDELRARLHSIEVGVIMIAIIAIGAAGRWLGHMLNPVLKAVLHWNDDLITVVEIVIVISAILAFVRWADRRTP